MELVKPYVDLWGEIPLTQRAAQMWIEKAARVCYDSESQITTESAPAFIKRLLRPNPAHSSVLEHSNIVLRSEELTYPITEAAQIKGALQSPFIFVKTHAGRVWIYGNYRAFTEATKIDFFKLPHALPSLFPNYDVITEPKDIPRFARAVTACFNTDRAVSHEIVRHRHQTAYSQRCITGDTQVSRYASKKCHYGIQNQWSVSRLYELYMNSDGKDKFSRIRLRGVLKDGSIVPVKIKKVFQTGVSRVFKMITRSGRVIKATADHRIITPAGEQKLKALNVGDLVLANGIPAYDNPDWLRQKYLVENIERKDLAKLVNRSDSFLGKRIAKFGLQKAHKNYPNRQPGYGRKGATSLVGRKRLSEMKKGNRNPQWKGGVWKSGNSKAVSLYPIENQLCSCGAPAKERHHIDFDSQNNKENNIEFLCASCHKARHFSGAMTVFPDAIVSIEPVGHEMTYDIEIDHECHNFVANGLVVHNSQRYCSEANLKICEPYWLEKATVEARKKFILHCYSVSDLYRQLKAMGYDNQGARAILPNCTSTVLVMSAYLPAWSWFFLLRTSAAAYPGIRRLSKDLQTQMIERGIEL